jgi:putative DNA primase/helicase
MQNIINTENFASFIMQEHGLSLVGDIKTDGGFHYLGTTDDKKGKKPFRYCVHLDDPPNVYYNDLKRGIRGTWYPKGNASMDEAERQRWQRESRIRKDKQDSETRAKQHNAAQLARMLWAKAKHADQEHPYLVRKDVHAHGLRQLWSWQKRVYQDDGSYKTIIVENTLLIPMHDEHGEIWNVQAIFSQFNEDLARDRDFLPRARVTGLFHWMGPRSKMVYLAEGYATAASIFEATGQRVLVCFSAGNLPAVALAVRAAMPDVQIIVCADNDLPDKNGRRAGIDKAEEAAALVGGIVAMLQSKARILMITRQFSKHPTKAR